MYLTYSEATPLEDGFNCDVIYSIPHRYRYVRPKVVGTRYTTEGVRFLELDLLWILTFWVTHLQFAGKYLGVPSIRSMTIPAGFAPMSSKKFSNALEVPNPQRSQPVMPAPP